MRALSAAVLSQSKALLPHVSTTGALPALVPPCGLSSRVDASAPALPPRTLCGSASQSALPAVPVARPPTPATAAVHGFPAKGVPIPIGASDSRTHLLRPPCLSSSRSNLRDVLRACPSGSGSNSSCESDGDDEDSDGVGPQSIGTAAALASCSPTTISVATSVVFSPGSFAGGAGGGGSAATGMDCPGASVGASTSTHGSYPGGTHNTTGGGSVNGAGGGVGGKISSSVGGLSGGAGNRSAIESPRVASTCRASLYGSKGQQYAGTGAANAFLAGAAGQQFLGGGVDSLPTALPLF